MNNEDNIIINIDIENDNKSLSIIINNHDINNDLTNWSITRKRIMLFVISFAAMTSPISSSILYPILLKLRTEFNVSDIEVNALGNENSELHEIFFSLCVCYGNCGRGLQSFGSSAMLSIGAGVISDVYNALERGTAYGFFYMAYWTGQLLGPMMGSYFAEYTSWRWIFWFLTILGGVNLLLVIIFVPETSNLPKPTPDDSSENAQSRYRFNPLAPLKLLRHPSGTLMIIYICIMSSITQLQFISVPVNFATRYHLTSSQIGSLFFVSGFGFMIGSYIGGKSSDIVMRRANKKNGTAHPEARIHSVWISAVLLPTCCLIYGWLVEKEVHMAGPSIAWFFMSLTTQVIYNSMSTYLVDVFSSQSASIIALSNCIRMMAAGTLSILASPMENKLGTGWTFTLLGGMCFAGILILVLNDEIFTT
ncbi:7581_t:CDS:2 [Entrophospora sp. SA101]|nr:7581_t:CDS:2 [Entrophospora sp. SA101]